MKRALVLAGVLALGISVGSLTTANAQDGATTDAPVESAEATLAKKEDLARKLMSVMNAGGLGKFTMDQMADSFDAMPGLPPGFMEKFKEMVTGDDLVELLVPVYAKHYEVDVMEAAIAYYESPMGKAYVEGQTPLMKDAMKVSEAWGQQKAMEVFAELNK